ncbi:MAG TPA: hypothetical protein VN681_05805 [Stellaceae bacterium]|nr:hypothetical protein [Stellaceae bacterium]
MSLPTRARWLALALWLAGLLAPATVVAEEPAARRRVPGIDAACRADANQRARAELRLQAVEWLDDPAKPAAAPSGDAHAVTRIELAGRARSPSGPVRLWANCTYAKDQPAVVAVRAQPALDLSGAAPVPMPLPDASAPQGLAAPGTAADEPSPTIRLTPTLKEMPFDPLTNNARRQDFIGSHEFAIKLQTPF